MAGTPSKWGANSISTRSTPTRMSIFNGAFLFQGTETGLDLADFLLGVPATTPGRLSAGSITATNILAPFAQDSWKLKSNLMVNYGLRWDVIPPWYEKYNQLQTLVFGEQSTRLSRSAGRTGLSRRRGRTANPCAHKIRQLRAARGHFLLAQCESGYWQSSSARRDQHSGRVWPLLHGVRRIVCRHHEREPALRLRRIRCVAPPLFATPFVTAASGQGVGQRFPLTFPPFGASISHPNSNVDWQQYLPITGVPSFFHGNVPPYTEGYSLSLERQIGGGTFLTVRYAGSEAHHLLVLTSANPGNPALCLSLSQTSDVRPAPRPADRSARVARTPHH